MTRADQARLDAPFEMAGLGERERGWTCLDPNELARLLQFARDSTIVRAVMAVCYNNMLTMPMTIQCKGKKAAEASGDASAEARARVFAEFGRKAVFADAAFGFLLVSCRPSTPQEQAMDPHYDMPYRPTLLKLTQLRVQFRVDIFDQYEWKVERPSFDGVKGWVLVPPETYFVCGTNLPTPEHGICSKLACLRGHEWRMLDSKFELTMDADQQRAHPRKTLQNQEQKSDDAGGVVPPFQHAASAETETEEAIAHRVAVDAVGSNNQHTAAAAAVHDRVDGLNCGAVGRRGGTSTLETGDYDYLPAGKEYVAVQVAEAPTDLPTARLMLLESTCLVFSVPMALVSGGDATGKATLQSGAAPGPDTAQIFRDAQQTNKRWVCRLVSDTCRFITNTEQRIYDVAALEVAEKFERAKVEKRRGKRGSKRKVMDDESPTELDDDEETRIVSEVLKATHAQQEWEVGMVSSARLEDVMALHQIGMLRDDEKLRQLYRDCTGIPLDVFALKQELSKEQQIIFEKLPPPPKPDAKPAKKKAKK